MGWGTGNLGGGSGGGLNFKVVAYSTESNLLSAKPKENTIGVITTNEITGWTFSATAPNRPVNGMVWFSTGTSSGAEFNALKKNAIQVYPTAAKQYVSGNWVDKTAKSYQSGAWRDWLIQTYIFKSGKGALVELGNVAGTGAGSSWNITSESMSIGWGNADIFVSTVNAMDLSVYRTLYIDMEFNTLYDDTRSFIGVESAYPTVGNYNNRVAGIVLKKSELGETQARKTYSIDISAVDSGYITVHGVFAPTIYNIWVENV